MSSEDKHAYCIIAHNEPLVLKTLLELIDDERNDIFLLVDKKTDMALWGDIRPQKSGFWLANRVDIRWGDQSQIVAELSVFECAVAHGPYKIYHLLSGVDLPIKSQKEIHAFVNAHPDTEFIGFAEGESNERSLTLKTQYYHLFMPYMRHKNKVLRILCSILSDLSLRVQRAIGIKRHFSIELKKGANWVSITHEFCQYLLSRKNYILRTFKWMSCADEIYKQTLLWNSPFRSRVYMIENEYTSAVRAIDWQRGSPYVWGDLLLEEDEHILKYSEALFARKFSGKHSEIIKWIRKKIQGA